MKKGLLSRLVLLLDSWNKRSPACGFFTQIASMALRSLNRIRRSVKVLGHHSVLFVTPFFSPLLIKQVLVNASEGELLRVVSFIILFCAPLSLLIVPCFSWLQRRMKVVTEVRAEQLLGLFPVPLVANGCFSHPGPLLELLQHEQGHGSLSFLRGQGEHRKKGKRCLF